MDSSDNDNHFAGNGNMSRVSLVATPPNTSKTSSPLSSNTVNMESPRRSSRLSAKSPQISSRTTTQLNIHRTMSGSVIDSRSPKLSSRKRNSFSRGRGRRSDTNLPSDQSDDDEMICSNTTVKKKPSGLASRSEVLSQFEERTDGFKCITCKKIYQASKFSDSNLRKHLSSIHKIPNVLFKSQIDDNSKPRSAPISSERKRELHTAAVDCIIQDGLPFNIFMRPGMAHFLSVLVPGYKGPHRKTIRNRIFELYSSYTAKLRTILPQLGPIALTSDLWRSSKRISFISLTAHVFSEDYQSIPIVLGCRRFIGAHVSSKIEHYLDYELHRYGIKKEQIISITTDNGSNMKKATSAKYGSRISCTNHNLNLVVHKGLSLWKEPRADDIGIQLNFDIDEWEDIYDDESDNELDPDEDPDDAASVLISDEENDDDENNSINEDNPQLIPGNDEESETDSDVEVPFSLLTLTDNYSLPVDYFKLLNDVYELMKKTRLVVKFIRNHNPTNEYLNKHILLKRKDEKSTGGLVLDMIIRWNSSFLLLDRLISHKDFINSMFSFPNDIPDLTVKQRKRFKELTLNQNEWELLKIIKDVLAPFLQSTEILSGQHYPTMAYAYYVYSLLLHYFETTAQDGPITIALKRSLRFRFNIYCNEKLPADQMDLMLIGAFLDPFVYKLIDDKDRKMAKKIIFRKLNKSSTSHSNPSPLSTSRTISTINNKLTAFQKLALLCHHTLPISTTNKSSMTLDEEVSWYIKAASAKEADDFQRFWIKNGNQIPRLSNLVRRVNVIPATSVSSESLFSIASFLNRKQRSSLSSKTLRYLLVLKNQHMIDKLQQNSS